MSKLTMAPPQLLSTLPAPKQNAAALYDFSNDPWFKDRLEQGKPPAPKIKQVPPYGKRAGFIPRRVEDFGDGGAFPEIHVGYPTAILAFHARESSLHTHDANIAD